MSLGERIIDIISEAGVGYVEKTRTIHTRCPICGRDDKFSILKENGSCICYRGSCDFGKRWFPDWIALTLNIPLKDAKQMLKKPVEKQVSPDADLGIDLESLDKPPEPKPEPLSDIRQLDWPEFHMKPIDAPESNEGLLYMQKRGIPLEVAKSLDICYSSSIRRIVIPVKMNGKVLGYQARHIDQVPDKMRMRNNEGFRRELLVMFGDNLKNSDYAILAEGPFDAMKFWKVGGFVATMGKNVTEKQLKFVFSHNIKKLYLALDDDAWKEMMEIAEKSPVEVFRISVPESCRLRCEQMGKKADFGECTFEEAEAAFKNAKKMDQSTLIIGGFGG